MSTKYSKEEIHLKEFREVVKDVGRFKKDHPKLWEAMTSFDRHCIKGRKGPRPKNTRRRSTRRKSTRVNNSSNNNNNEEDAVPTNNAAANQDDGDDEESFLKPIDADEIPDKFVLLGLAPKTQADITRDPPNDAYRRFVKLLEEASDRYQEEGEDKLCQIVEVRSIMLSEDEVLPCIAALTFYVHHSCYLIFVRMLLQLWKKLDVDLSL